MAHAAAAMLDARDAEQGQQHHVEEAGPLHRRASGDAGQVQRDDPGEHRDGDASFRSQVTPDGHLARREAGHCRGSHHLLLIAAISFAEGRRQLMAR